MRPLRALGLASALFLAPQRSLAEEAGAPPEPVELGSARTEQLLRVAFPRYSPDTRRTEGTTGPFVARVQAKAHGDAELLLVVTTTAQRWDFDQVTVFALRGSPLAVADQYRLSAPQRHLDRAHLQVSGLELMPGATAVEVVMEHSQEGTWGTRARELLWYGGGRLHAVASYEDHPPTEGAGTTLEVVKDTPAGPWSVELHHLSTTFSGPMQPEQHERAESVVWTEGSYQAAPEGWKAPSPPTATASSELREGARVYRAADALDGDPRTAWAEGRKGPGLGQKLRVRLPKESPLEAFFILAGCGTTEALWKQNHRLKRIKVAVDGEEPRHVELQDVAAWQRVDLGYATTRNVELTVEEVYRGSRFDDACISEVLLDAAASPLGPVFPPPGPSEAQALATVLPETRRAIDRDPMGAREPLLLDWRIERQGPHLFVAALTSKPDAAYPWSLSVERREARLWALEVGAGGKLTVLDRLDLGARPWLEGLALRALPAAVSRGRPGVELEVVDGASRVRRFVTLEGGKLEAVLARVDLLGQRGTRFSTDGGTDVLGVTTEVATCEEATDGGTPACRSGTGVERLVWRDGLWASPPPGPSASPKLAAGKVARVPALARCGRRSGAVAGLGAPEREVPRASAEWLRGGLRATLTDALDEQDPRVTGFEVSSRFAADELLKRKLASGLELWGAPREQVIAALGPGAFAPDPTMLRQSRYERGAGNPTTPQELFCLSLPEGACSAFELPDTLAYPAENGWLDFYCPPFEGGRCTRLRVRWDSCR